MRTLTGDDVCDECLGTGLVPCGCPQRTGVDFGCIHSGYVYCECRKPLKEREKASDDGE